MSAPTDELIDAIYRDRVRASRELTVEQRLRAGAELFEEVCARLRDGIRAQYPDADPDEVERILHERIEIARRLDQVP